MLGRVRQGPERGRLLTFDECDEARWRHEALVESNLKLALLVAPDAPAGIALKERWHCRVHYALPVVLLAAAVQQSLRQIRGCFPSAKVQIFCGAPISPLHPSEQAIVFERALYAALLLAQRWGEDIPHIAEDAVLSAEQAWSDAEHLPPESDRTTRVVPEAFAAAEGVASAGGGVGLPSGRLCIVDMGGGTTDVAWLTNHSSATFTPHRIESFDIAGERLEAVIASHASRSTKRRVPRQEVWKARVGWDSAGERLEGDGWSFDLPQLREMLRGTLQELGVQFRNAINALEPGGRISPRTQFVFVGGATFWEPLKELLLGSIRDLHEDVATVSVKGYGLAEEVGDTPMAVALGLSNGYTSLQEDRWKPALTPELPAAPHIPTDRFRECGCRGLLPCCPRCGGSGAMTSEGGLDRFAMSIDPFAGHVLAIRCPTCLVDFPRDRIFEHLKDAHQFVAPHPPTARPQPPMVATLLRDGAVRCALRDGDARGLSRAEGLVVSELRWIESVCFSSTTSNGATGDSQSSTKKFLQNSVGLTSRLPWVHLPRAVAFGILGDYDSAKSELDKARSAGFGYVDEVDALLSSGRPTQFAEAWEHLIR
jgi:hypothetical protein